MFVNLLEYAVLLVIMVAFPVRFTDALKGPCSVDAAAWWMGKHYFFKGDIYIQWEDSDKASEWRSMKYWPGIPNNLDAAAFWKENTYFFKGCSYWKVDNKDGKVMNGYPKDIKKEWNSPCNIDAGTTRSTNTYLFKGETYVAWSYNGDRNWEGNTREGWKGMEGNLDAAIYIDLSNYFFTGDYYWTLSVTDELTKSKVFENWNGLESNLLKNCPCVCKRCCNEKWKLVGPIKYKLSEGTVAISLPKNSGELIIDQRRSSVGTTAHFTASETVVESKTFTNTVGASLTVGTEFETGIPLIVKGTVSVELSASYAHTWGTSKTKSVTKSTTQTCTAPAGKRTKCLATNTVTTMDVPYTMTVKHVDKGCTCESSGVFEQVSTSNVHLTSWQF